MTSPETKALLTNRIGAVIDQFILPIFKDGAKVTVLVRHPGFDDANVVVTGDDDAGILAIVDRQFPVASRTVTDQQILHIWDGYVGEPTSVLPFTDNDKVAFARAAIALAATPAPEARSLETVVQPVAYVNGDDLDNMLDDRAAVIQRTRSGFRNTPLYAAAQPCTPQGCALHTKLIAAANYIDALGGDSKSYRAAINSARAAGGKQP